MVVCTRQETYVESAESVTPELPTFADSAPRGGIAMLTSLNANLPRYALAAYTDPATLGAFALASSLLLAPSLVAGSIAQAILPRLRQAFQTEGVSGVYSLLKTWCVGAGIAATSTVLVVAMISEPLVSLLGLEALPAHAEILIALSVAAGVGYLSWGLNTSILVVNRHREQWRRYVVASLCSGLLTVLLVAQWDALGAAIGSVIVAASQVVTATVVMRPMGQTLTRGEPRR
jgi:O-antigen/teichoic acid export membrane protein